MNTFNLEDSKRANDEFCSGLQFPLALFSVDVDSACRGVEYIGIVIIWGASFSIWKAEFLSYSISFADRL